MEIIQFTALLKTMEQKLLTQKEEVITQNIIFPTLKKNGRKKKKKKLNFKVVKKKIK